MGAGPSPLPPPVFVNDADGLDPNLILADMISAFEAAAGRTLQPAQVERLLINLYAYRESLVRNAIQYAAQQNLLAFAAFPMLDYLGQLLGVARLAAQGAVTTIQFTLANALNQSYTIAAGMLVGTSDGALQFATDVDLTIAAGSTQGSVSATCTTPGAQGNGYLAGQINVLLNPSALIAAAANTATSSGGSAPETDDDLRARIQAAPGRFSVAGPAGAYSFFAKSVDPAIIDVLVTSPQPGSVNVYLLTGPIAAQPSALVQYSANVTVGSDAGGVFVSFASPLAAPPPIGSLLQNISAAPPGGVVGAHASVVVSGSGGVAPSASKVYVTPAAATPIVNGDDVIATGGNPAGVAGNALLAEVSAALSSDAVRPLTDTVNVLPVTEIDYAISATLTIYSDADPVGTQALAMTAAQQLAINLASRVQRNVVCSQIIAALSVAGVYEVALAAPASDLVLTAGQWANCLAITLNIVVGTEHS